MVIEDFLVQSRSNPHLAIPSQLEVGGGLAQVFFQGREEAEAEGVEYGSSLYWAANRVVTDEPIRGHQTGVQLNTRENSQIPSYVGNWHVHPYKQKMCNTASIGFSTEDIGIFLGVIPPPDRRFDIRLHFVIAGPKLWLMVIYPWTSQREGEAWPVETDVSALLNFIGSSDSSYTRWHDAQAVIGGNGTLRERIVAERMMCDDIPGYGAVFAKASRRMNKALAEHHQYGLYIGEFGDRHTGMTDRPVFLQQKR
ncbi:hypothetical protein ACVFYP_24400 [Roseomonas sp. F4]